MFIVYIHSWCLLKNNSSTVRDLVEYFLLHYMWKILYLFHVFIHAFAIYLLKQYIYYICYTITFIFSFRSVLACSI